MADSAAPTTGPSAAMRGRAIRSLPALILSLALLSGPGPATGEEHVPRAAFGRATFELSCVVCHGARGRGDGAMAGALAVPAPDLTRLARRNGGPFPRERVRAIIEGGPARAEHGGQMPAWGLLFLKDFEAGPAGVPMDRRALVQRRIEDLVIYLESIQE